MIDEAGRDLHDVTRPLLQHFGRDAFGDPEEASKIGRKDRSAEFSINPATFEKTDWKTVGLGPTDADKLKVHFGQALEDVFVKAVHEH